MKLKRPKDVLAARVRAAAKHFECRRAAGWRINMVLREVYECRVAELTDEQATDALAIMDLIDRRIAWLEAQRAQCGEPLAPYRQAFIDLNLILPRDTGRDYKRLEALPECRPDPPSRPPPAPAVLATTEPDQVTLPPGVADFNRYKVRRMADHMAKVAQCLRESEEEAWRIKYRRSLEEEATRRLMAQRAGALRTPEALGCERRRLTDEEVKVLGAQLRARMEARELGLIAE